MRVVSLFTGVGGFDAGLEQAGHEVVYQCESDEWRRAVLAHHWPDVPCGDDVCSFAAGWSGRVERAASGVDLVCGGFPCQDVSVAGARAGLAGARSALFFEFVRILDTIGPRWALIENVPGLFSSHGGRDFGVVLEALADVGYGVAWRVLDSQFFGVPQRRRRVYIVAHRADGDPRTAAERAAAVLAVGSRCGRDHQARGETRPEIAGTLGGRVGGSQDIDRNGAWVTDHYYVEDHVDGTLRANGANDGPPRIDRQPLVVAGAITSSVGQLDDQDVTRLVTAFHMTQDPISGEVAPEMGRGSKRGTANIGVSSASGVRRLTPRECERLQGFPDDWTLVPGVRCSDSRRYAAMGDAVTVPVARWLGERFTKESIVCPP